MRKSLLALLALSFAAAATASAAGQLIIRTGVPGIYYGFATASAQACTPGTAGNWVEADGVFVEDSVRRVSLTFSAPLAADLFRVAMNGIGSRDLALVEFMGTDGVWRKAWAGNLGAPNPNFSQMCLEQPVPQKQVVQAVRYTFRKGPGDVQLDHAALLRR